MNLKTKNADFLLNTFSFISKFSIGAYYSKKVLHVYQTGKNYYDVAFLGTLSKKICYTYKVKGYIQLNRACGLKKTILKILGDFGYSQNGGGTLSDFLILSSPWLYLHLPTCWSPKPAHKYPKSCPQFTQNHQFGSPYLSLW